MIGVTSEHFGEHELCCHHCGINGAKSELVDALEALRAAIGKPITLDSAYRCPAHNAAVGGAPNSEHTQGIAADIRVEGMTAIDIYYAVLKIPAFRGIGVAVKQQYVHVDVRASEARWAYDAAGKWCRWNLDLPLSLPAAEPGPVELVQATEPEIDDPEAG